MLVPGGWVAEKRRRLRVALVYPGVRERGLGGGFSRDRQERGSLLAGGLRGQGRGVGWPDKPASAGARDNTGRRGAGLVVYPGVRR